MTIRILINGAFGRMGQLAVKAISDYPGFELVGQTGREYDLKKSIKDSHAQVVIDFTNAESVFANTLAIIETGAHPVIGTSGLQLDQIVSLQEHCKTLKLGGIIAPNFSLGAMMMMKTAKEIAKYMPHLEIIEMHHPAKLDSPSGTALRTAEILAEATEQLAESSVKPPLRETLPHARGATYKGIPIHAIRLPGLLAHQEIIFGNIGETLTLRHDSLDRACFIPGICLACEKVMSLNELIYGLETIL